MVRLPRNAGSGHPHQVAPWGIDRDRVIYLRLMREAAVKYGLEFTGFSLITIHTQPAINPQGPDCLHLGMKWVHAAYARYVHASYGGRGHLWQARYFSCIVADAHVWNALAYVELNPVQAGWWNALNATIGPAPRLACG